MSETSERTRAKRSEGYTRLVAYVGSYENSPNPNGGGIYVFDVSSDGRDLALLSQVDEPKMAGCLVYSSSLGALYAVDERKTDGRGPVGPAARVHAFAVNQHDGSLTWLNSQLAPGPYPTFLSVDDSKRIAVSANHGSFDHVEHVVQKADGEWTTEYLYDDSTVIMYNVESDGRIGKIRDIQVLIGHGKDPNNSPQAGGHGQASAHAHCAVIDPSGRHVVVCDKATDQILVFRLGSKLEIASTCQLPAETGPRHVAFDPSSGRAFVTFEFSSEIASFDFNVISGNCGCLTSSRRLSVATRAQTSPQKCVSTRMAGSST